MRTMTLLAAAHPVDKKNSGRNRDQKTMRALLAFSVFVAAPSMAVGRACIIGDAAFAVRPHAAAGTAKAAENAWTLAAAVAGAGGDLPGALQQWSAHQSALGRNLLQRTRHHGDGSQFRCDWKPGDPAHRFGLYEPGDSCVWAHPRSATRESPKLS